MHAYSYIVTVLADSPGAADLKLYRRLEGPCRFTRINTPTDTPPIFRKDWHDWFDGGYVDQAGLDADAAKLANDQ